MKDVLTVALERQRELRSEIAELDEFVRMAESLLRNAGSKARQGPEHAERTETADRAERTKDAETPVRSESAERPQVVETPAAANEPAPEPVARKFPWSNAQPPVRKTDGDDETGPTRRNLMRREAS